MLKAALLSAVAFTLCLPAESGAKTYSWGLPGSSRASFESISHECALGVARRDVSEDGSTRKFLRGFEVLERENNMPLMAGQSMEDSGERARRQVLLRKAYSTEQHIDGLQDTLQQDLNACLVKAGYIRFALSDEQEKKLKKLKAGSEGRKRYLYELGSDRDLVLSQRVAN